VEWSVEIANSTVEDELRDLPLDLQADFSRLSRLIAHHGPMKVNAELLKHLEGELWEMRLRGKDGIARAIYVTRIGRRVVVVRVFEKKTQKTPRREIDLALKRARDIK
jgi:phage-related protein